MAVWYKDTGPWWAQSPLAKGGYISLETEVNKPDSILSYYKYLLALRKANSELITGDQAIVENDNNNVFSFVRFDGARRALVAVNLASTPLTVHVTACEATSAPQNATLRNIISGDVVTRGADGNFALTLQEYGVRIYEILTTN